METHGFWTELKKPLKLENFERLSPPQSNPRGAATCIYISALTCNMNLRLSCLPLDTQLKHLKKFPTSSQKFSAKQFFGVVSRSFSSLASAQEKDCCGVAPLGLE